MRIGPIGALPDEGLTIDVIKAIRLGPARAYARLNSPRTFSGARATHNGRGRPPTLKPRFYREAWERYRALIQSGAKAPAKTLAEEYGYSRTAMRSVLGRCKKMLELQPTDVTAGRKGSHGKTTRKKVKIDRTAPRRAMASTDLARLERREAPRQVSVCRNAR